MSNFMRDSGIYRITTPSDEVRARISAALKGRSLAPETVEKIRKANTGKTRPPNAVERTRMAHIGSKRSIEAREKMSIAHKGVPLSRDHVEKIAALNKGRKPSPQTIAATIISNATRGCSIATREKMAASQKARYARARLSPE